MTIPSFSAVDQASGLYRGSSASGITLYYQSLSGTDQGASPDPETLWTSDPGCWFFAPADATISDANTFATDLKHALDVSGTAAPKQRWIAWIADPNAIDLSAAPKVLIGEAAGNYQVNANAAIPFGNVSVQIPNQSVVALDAAGGRFTITKGSTTSLPSLKGTIIARDIGSGEIAVPLVDDAIGALSFAANWKSGDLYSLFDTTSSFDASPGPEIRFFHPSDSTTGTFRFPFLVGAAGGDGDTLYFHVRMDPLNPTDSDRTLFGFDNASFPDGTPPTCSFYRTPMGNTVVLTPEQDAGGFALGKRFDDSGSIDGAFVSYLVPGGRYAVGVEGATPANVQVMCGVGGTEFLLVENGDALDFVAGQPAMASTFDPSAPKSSKLTDDYTTAWVRVVPTTPSGLIPGYCVQAQDYLYFGASSGSLPYPLAVGCRMADLSDSSTTDPVPMAPYASIYVTDDDAGFDNPNPNTAATVFAAFERLVVAAARRNGLRPKFDFEYGPTYFDVEDNSAFSGGTIRTAKGFLATLNGDATNTGPAGTLANLKFAKSPEHSALFDKSQQSSADQDLAYLQFQSGGNVDPASQDVISPLLSNTLEDDNLFLVAASTDNTTSKNPFGKYQNQISIGEFIFQLDTNALDESLGTGGVVTIFKFVDDAKVVDLVDDLDTWRETETFLGEDATTAQAKLQCWIATAKAAVEGDDPEKKAYFADIYSKLTDKEWSGVLSFGCPLPYGELTPDLQMLLGGIDGRLQGFHFGVTANRIAGDPGAGSIANSSLFGLIFYQNDLETDAAQANRTHFQVPDFKALFRNSALTAFESKVAMTVPQLYGDQVALTSGTGEDQTSSNEHPAGILVIDGAYQKNANGGEGSVAFDSTEPRTFSYTTLPSKLGTPGFRAIDTALTSDASLLPVTPNTTLPVDAVTCLPSDGDETILKSAFRLNGNLAFNKDLGSGLDLFSYEQDPGLAFTGYPFNMWTMIRGNTACIAQDAHGYQVLLVDPTEVLLDDSNVTPRPTSLIGTMPTQLSGLRYDGAGMSAASLGGWPVTQENGGVLEASGSTTYALAFDLPLGTLGDLVSSKEKLFATLVLGWQPSGDAVTTDDTISLVLVLPDQMGGTHGSFKYQGIMELDFEAVQLSLVPAPTDPKPPPYTALYTFTMTNVRTLLFGWATINPDQKRKLVFYGNPKGPHTLDLLWFMDESPVETTKLETFLSFTPVVGMSQGLDVTLPTTQIAAVGDAITELTKIPGTTQDVVTSIYNPTGTGGDSPKITANPEAGALFFLSIFFEPLSLQILLDDPSFYGGRLALGTPEKPEKGKKDEGKKGSDGPLATFGGMEIEIVYRRVNDHLGALSIDFVLPDKFRKIYFGPPDNPETPVLSLPEIGIEIFIPNGDWKIAVGWPFGTAKALSLKIPIEGIPILFSLGFFVAKLRSEDLGKGNGDFGLIWEFGVGLSGGPHFAGKAAGGILSWSADIYVSASIQGTLGSCKGAITSGGSDYHWFAISAGATLSLSGKVDLKIISASITVTASLAITVAWETDTATRLVVAATVTVSVKVHIVFFTIHFHMSIHVTILDAAFGHGNPTKISGWSPPDDFCAQQSAAAVAQVSGASSLAPPMMALLEEPPTTMMAGATEAVGSADPVTVKAYFAIQPAAVLNPGVTAYAVATFLIGCPDSNDATATTQFTKMASAVAAWTVVKYGGSGTAAQQLANVQAKLDDGTFHGDILTCIEDSLIFDLAQPAPTTQTTVAALPAFPQLARTYNGTTTGFDSNAAADGYEAAVQTYFGNTPSANNHPSPLDDSVAGIVFVDYFVMIVRQVNSSMQAAITADSSITIAQALDPSTGNISYGNVAGIVTRFLKHGLRLPYPDPSASDPTLYPIFELTCQQFAIEDAGDPKTHVLDAELVAGAAALPSWIHLGGTGHQDPVTASLDSTLVLDAAWNGDPGWTAEPMEPTTAVQQKFLLHTNYTIDDTSVIRTLPSGLQAEALARGGVTVTTEIPPAKQGDPTTAGPAVRPILRTPVQIRKIPVPGTTGQFVEHVYQVVGATEADRERLQMLLDAVEAGSTSISKLSIFAAPSGGEYATVPMGAATILVKTDLAAGSEPQTGAAPASDDSAQPSSADEFLRLVWEVSIVHRAGFYLYETSIPDAIFSGNAGTLMLLIETSATPQQTLTVEPYHSGLLIADKANDPDVMQVALSDSTGPIWVYRPNLPAGYAGYRLTWPDAPTDPTAGNNADFIKELYHIVSSRVATALDGVSTNWSPPVGGNDSQQAEKVPSKNEEQTGAWYYQRFDRMFAAGTSPYIHVGSQVEFDLQVVDIYGNAIPATKDVKPTLTYNDALVSIDRWFGTNFTYLVTPGATAGTVTLTITTSFTTSAIAADPNKPTSQEEVQAQHALATYEALRWQLKDTDHVTLSVQPYFTDSDGEKLGLCGTPITKDASGTSLQEALEDYITPVIAWLQAVAAGTAPPSDPATASLVMSIDAGYIADPNNIKIDLFPLVVNVVIERTDVDDTIAGELPAARTVATQIAPLKDPEATDPATNALREFARDFELAYNGYDGSGGVLKLAQGTNPHENPDTRSGTRAIWVTRWGSKGMTVAFEDQPTYFAPTPLSTQLLTGSFKVHDYRAAWDGTDADYTTVDHQFNHIDLDAWASEFLDSFGEVLGPQTVVGIPTLPGDPYPALIESKRTLADLLSLNSGGEAGPRVATVAKAPEHVGVLDDAATHFKETLLSMLRSDYSLSTIVQVPATVGIEGSVENGVSTTNPPNVYGKVTSAGETADSPYTISPTKLPLVAGNETASLMLWAKNPGAQQELDLDLSYNIGFLEHEFEVSEGDTGYVPSSWLTFILPMNDDVPNPLDQHIGTVDAPIPLRSFPTAPVLIGQDAVQQRQQPDPDSGGNPQQYPPDEYMMWDYSMTVGRPLADQDDLLVKVSFNQPVAAPTSAPPRGGAPVGSRDEPDVFEAFARFYYEWRAIKAELAKVSPDSRDDTVGAAAIARYQELVDGITTALPKWVNPALTAQQTDGDSDSVSQEPPAFAWEYRIIFHQDGLAPGSFRVTRIQPDENAKTLDPKIVPWPDIVGYTTPTADDVTADYTGSTSTAALTLTWNELYVLSHQSVRGSVVVERNIDILPQGQEVNPAFVYRTEEVVFPDVLTPQIEVPYLITWDSHSSLADAVSTLLGDVFSKADIHVDDSLPLHLDLVTGYEYELVKDTEGTILTRSPVYLVQPPPGFEFGGLAGFESDLATGLQDWRVQVNPSQAGGSLSFDLTIFAADSISSGSLVLVHYGDLRIPIPDPAKDPDWWG